MTGSLFPFLVQPRLICEELTAVAVKFIGSLIEEQVMKQKVISFVVLFSAMLISGFAVLAAARDFELGVVLREGGFIGSSRPGHPPY